MTSGREPPAGWDEYWRAVSDGDTGGAVQVAVDLHENGTSMVDILERLVAPAQIEVGRLWAANEWNVAQEHRATSVGEEVVAALARRSTPTGPRGVAVVTCVDGEWHSLPARLVATVLTAGGWRVHYLGASVPVAHLSQFLQDAGPDVTGISCSVPTALPRARAMIEASRDAGVPVLAGGRGFGPGGRWARTLGANAVATSAREALEILSSPSWSSYTGPAPRRVLPDESSRALARQRVRIVGGALSRLEAAWPGMRGYSDYQRARTEEDLGYLVDFLGAALYVDDVDLYREFIVWMAGVLASRDVPVQALQAGISVLSEAVRQALDGEDRPQRYLDAALEELRSLGRERVTSRSTR